MQKTRDKFEKMGDINLGQASNYWKKIVTWRQSLRCTKITLGSQSQKNHQYQFEQLTFDSK